MDTPARLLYRRHIERSRDDYSAWAMVEHLRSEARSSWRVMHQARRARAQYGTESVDYRIEDQVERYAKRDLLKALAALNAGLDREGSYERARTRRWRRELPRVDGPSGDELR